MSQIFEDLNRESRRSAEKAAAIAHVTSARCHPRACDDPGSGIGAGVAVHGGSTLLAVVNAFRLIAYRDPVEEV